MVRGQMKIQQMAFMLVAVFLFFMMVGLFFLQIQFKDIESEFESLQKAQAISLLEMIADMAELNYDSDESMTLDEDKLAVMSGELGSDYDSFWPVASIEVYKIYPGYDEAVECPGPGCNYYEIYDSGQRNKKTYSAYVSICKKISDSGVRDVCEIGKLVVGVIVYEE